jgi:putative RecB family exonuclease
VDEYVRIREELDSHKKEAGEKLEKLKQALVAFCENNKVSVVAGTKNKAIVTLNKTWKLPEKNSEARTRLLDVLEELGRSEEVMGFDSHALVEVLQEKKWDDGELEKIAEFAHQEIGYRLKISKRKEE